MHRQIIEHHHVARPQGGAEYLVHVGRERVPVDDLIHAQQRPEAVGGQRGDERHVRAAPQRHGLVQPSAGRGTAVAAAVGQGGARLVYEYETSDIFFLNGFHKQATQFYPAFGVALGGVDAFLRPQPRRSTACHPAVRCNDGPPAATRA